LPASMKASQIFNLFIKELVKPVNLGKVVYKYYASSQAFVVKIFLFGFGFEFIF
jgi:high-affinity K+ transport system ATPase subunit B